MSLQRHQAEQALLEYMNEIDPDELLYHDEDMMYYTGQRGIVYIVFSDSDGIHVGTITESQLDQQTYTAIEQDHLSKQLDDLLDESGICPECGQPNNMCMHGYYEE